MNSCNITQVATHLFIKSDKGNYKKIAKKNALLFSKVCRISQLPIFNGEIISFSKDWCSIESGNSNKLLDSNSLTGFIVFSFNEDDKLSDDKVYESLRVDINNIEKVDEGFKIGTNVESNVEYNLMLKHNGEVEIISSEVVEHSCSLVNIEVDIKSQ